MSDRGTATVVGLGGSMARISRSRAALALALEGARDAGARVDLLDIRELDLPMFDPDSTLTTEAATRLIEVCYGADGMVWSSPLYQGTVSGAFKNALDWLHVLGERDPPFLHDTVIGLIGAAGGSHALQAIDTMGFSVRALRGWAVPYVVPVATAARAFDVEGTVRDETVERQLRMLGGEVVRVAGLFAADRSAEREPECAKAAERVAAVG